MKFCISAFREAKQDSKISKEKLEVVSNKNLLFIFYYFPPVGTVGSLRNYNIARQLTGYFDQSHLITIKNKPFLLGDEPDLDFLQIHEVANFDYRNLAKILSKKENIQAKISAKKHKKGIGFIRKLLDSYPGNLLLGEGGLIYILTAAHRASQIIKKHHITHIYSSFRPFADHYIAHILKKRFPHLLWIADFRDLPVDENRNNVFFKKYQERINKRMFSKTTIVSTVSEGLKTKISTYNKQTIVVRNGLQTLFKPPNVQRPDKFTVTYTGSLYPDQQKPQLLFASLKKLLNNGLIRVEKFKLIYAGKDSGIWQAYIGEFGLDSISEIKGKLRLSESIRLQYESHINLLLSWSGPHTGGVLTGKLFEYLAAAKPILCLINGNRDMEFEDLFNDLNAGSVFYVGQEDLVTAKILFYYNEWLNTGTINHKMNKSELRELSWEKTIELLVEKLFV